MFIEGQEDYQAHLDPRCGEPMVIQVVPTFLVINGDDTLPVRAHS